MIVFAFFGIFLIYLAIHSWRYRVKVRERDSRVRTASAEAAADDAYFEASELESHARGLFVACQEAWDARDVARLSSLVGPDLMVEWKRRLDDFESKGWHNRVSVLAPPKIEYVGLVNREDDTEDRAVVRITASLRAFVVDRSGQKIMRKEAKSERIELVEYSTLARSAADSDSRADAAGWKVVSIEQRAEGDHHLDSEIVASPWSDPRLADEALTELAVADGLPPGFTTADLAVVSFDGSAREQALDLSLADARFAPTSWRRRRGKRWRRGRRRWTGTTRLFLKSRRTRRWRSCCTAATPREDPLGGPRPTRREIRITAVDISTEAATMTIEVELGGRRYVEDRDTAGVVRGSKDRPIRFNETWGFVIEDDEKTLWRLGGASAEGVGASP